MVPRLIPIFLIIAWCSVDLPVLRCALADEQDVVVAEAAAAVAIDEARKEAAITADEAAQAAAVAAEREAVAARKAAFTAEAAVAEVNKIKSEVTEKQAKQQQERLAKAMDQQRQVYQRQIDLVIDELKHICNLKEAQIKKLGIAAKGAINGKMDESKKRMERTQKELGERFDFFVGGENRLEQLVAVQGQQQMMELRSFVTSTGNITNDTFWKKAVDKVLTDEQKSSHGKALADRLQRRREVQIAAFVAELDEKLLLTKVQRTKILEILKEDKSTTVRSVVTRTARPVRAGVFARASTRTAYSPFAPNSAQTKKISSVLSKTQAAEWKNSLSGPPILPPHPVPVLRGR